VRVALKGLWFVIVFCLAGPEVSGSVTTNTAGLQEPPPPAAPRVVLPHTPPFPEGFFNVYARELQRTANRAAIDRLQAPDATLALVQQLERDQYEFHHHFGLVGSHVFADGALDGLRETCVAQLPFEQWAQNDSPLPEQLLANLVSGSVGNTFEERMTSVSVSSSYSGRERPWLTYGVRPWQLRPYAYFTLALGRFAGKPVLLDTRCYSLLDAKHIGLMRVQEQMLIPLFDSCNIVVDLFLYPTEMHAPDHTPSASVRLEKTIHIGRSAEVFFIGAQTGPRITQCTAGCALLRW
jgi:hypothetical protein